MYALVLETQPLLIVSDMLRCAGVPGRRWSAMNSKNRSATAMTGRERASTRTAPVRLDGGFATPEIFDFPAGRSVVRGQHDRPRRGLLQRDGPRPGPDRPVHPQGDEAIAARPAPPGRRVAEAGGARAGAGAGGQGSPASPGRAMR